MSTATRSLIFTGITTATLALFGYAIYFDYQRRSNTEFRNSLKKRQFKYDKDLASAKEQEKRTKLVELKQYLTVELLKNPIPTNPESYESSFPSLVEQGEKLSGVPGKELEASLQFYKALSIYPNPANLLSIYQRSIPEAIYDNIVLMIAVLPPSNVSSFISAASGGASASASVVGSPTDAEIDE
ncbi:related to Mitochondrial import receptor subunit TOM20 [Saccharomycodes ludwigii]|uniref:Related to Mitochondrial import receptor subunit TOM20 n=1 Tax=Saccharomycodes ludwigii TaxID=36035 RepID=A0A376B8R9_9ASCO|nr:hypothetical protein SCDLUD_000516 [Saccharomycodes ludwigii]KAH3902921.1 hypothetical protein SCDLUD_000516 [Saccharomycodes ludwigii]SSD61011.1 related to Mitochondrial import receptor subunit TOM20 [Saccharomycodes ludwigii]